jgi:hypothetical protein
MAMATILACSPAPAGQDPGQDADTCAAGFLGDRTGAADFEPLVLLADDSVAVVQDGGSVPLLFPPQGGRVLFVGVRATNVEGCALQLTGTLRDMASNRTSVDSRLIDLISTGDGWGASAMSGTPALSAVIASFSNINACPNDWSTTDLYGHAYGLEVTIVDRNKKRLTKQLQVTPECGQPANMGECLCICKAGYVPGTPCPM